MTDDLTTLAACMDLISRLGDAGVLTHHRMLLIISELGDVLEILSKREEERYLVSINASQPELG